MDTTGCGDAYFAIASILLMINAPKQIIPFLSNIYAGMHSLNIANKEIVSKGNFFVENGFLVVKRTDSLLSYKLKYALSIDSETLVIMKPNSRQAWLFFRTGF